MVVSWYWIPVGFYIGFMFGALLVSVFAMARRG